MPTDNRRPSNPDRTPWENHARRSGTLLLISGITLGASTFISLLSLLFLHPGGMRTETLIYISLASLVLIAAAAAMAGGGIAERLQRPVRWVGWRALTHAEQTSASIAGISSMIGQINDRLDAIDERLERQEERIDELPGYGRGVMDGATLREQVSRDSR